MPPELVRATQREVEDGTSDRHRHFAHAPYTHAAIYVGEGIIAESVSPDDVVQNVLADAIDEASVSACYARNLVSARALRVQALPL